ncbi:sigma-70 family RNA polymerase sigma factor [Desulfosporosinus youngiae]|uniref:sigma-70 family RNA polymerase sigma factor n=1 Tax=Desulfosporosinus youngiae TaxID=339862 RepID=UPI0002F5CB3B|nr:sigma-70 family RNA polymerase sigma factor [Desulfosporosinus youngiae]
MKWQRGEDVSNWNQGRLYVSRKLNKGEEWRKLKLNNEVLKLIETVVNKVAQESAKAATQDTLVERNFFQETETLLYNYQALKLKVAQDEEFLFDPEAYTTPTNNRSKDIIRFSTSNTGSHGLDIDRYTQGIKSSMMRTRQEVMRIDRALEVIKDDKYYEIVPMKYWDGMTIESIASDLECDEKTVRRNKNRLVNKLKIMLFGADALNENVRVLPD